MTFGLFLLLLGIGFPFLMVIHVVEPTFTFIFLSSGSSTVGLALGMVGLTQWSIRSVKKKTQFHDEEGEWIPGK
jgi:hypothetical protein